MVYAMKMEELAKWVKHKAKFGDLAYCYNHYDERHYFYNYKGPDDNPFWVMFQDDTIDKYLEINKLKVEEPKMEKRCDNCKYFKNGRSYNYCSHIEHNGFIVPAYTSCVDHEEKEKLAGPFDNLKFFIKDTSTGELDLKYICEDCGKIMEKPFHWQFRVPLNNQPNKRPGYWYWCEECWEKKQKK